MSHIELAFEELETEIKRCISIFNKNTCEEIFSKIFLESRKSLNKDSVIKPTDAGKMYGLDNPKDKTEIKLRQKFIKECPEGHEVDHIIPVAKGGSNDLSNLQWLPKNLNLWKRDKDFLNDVYFPHCSVNIKEEILLNKHEREKEKVVRFLAKEYGLDQNSIISLYDYMLKFSFLSTSYIMRKLKCSSSMAKSIQEVIEKSKS